MNKVFSSVRNKFVLVYLDDILTFSESIDDHVEHLREVLEILRDQRFFATMSKCFFALSEVHFLGHMVGKDGLEVDLRKTAAVQDWPVPADVSQVRSFMGLANNFRRFVLQDLM